MIITSNGQMINQGISREFPVKISRVEYYEPGPVRKSHWHEEFMIFYIEKGAAVIHCNSQPIPVSAGDVVVINSNDIHYVENKCSHLIEHYVLVDLAFLLSSQADLCQTQYIAPLQQQQIRFRNQIPHDPEVLQQLFTLLEEYRRQDYGYELMIKSRLYHLLVLLLRRYTVTPADDAAYKWQHQLRPVLQYVDEHYEQKLTLETLAAMAHMSRHHFYRLFKSITGMPPIEYVNRLRIQAASKLLQQKQLPVHEIAQAVGIPDSNYFSRLFKKYQQVSPSSLQSRD